MIRQPIRSGTRGTQKSQTDTFPAPTGGWNTFDDPANMGKTFATVMENWISYGSDVKVRKGCALQCSGFADQPGAFLPWRGPASQKLFASTATAIYDVTTAGAIGAAVATCTSQAWSSINFTTPGGSFLIAANGQDSVKEYDGTTWKIITGVSTPAITGVATTALNYVASMVSRVWFVEANSTRAWYLPVLSIGGAAASFDLGQVFTRGGYLVAMQGWTLDGGSGQDDYSVFISSEGEVAVYKGTDPASASTWSKVGTYYVGRPLGKYCLTKYGGDLLILCENGLFPLSKALLSADITRSSTISNKIDPTFQSAVTNYGTNIGWRCVIFPQANLILVNVPISATYAEQYVMSTITGSWSKFTGWAASDFVVFAGKLFFTSPTTVDQAWIGTSDKGVPILAKCQQAFSYFSTPAREKHMKLIRPTISATDSISLQASLAVDFRDTLFPSIVALAFSTGAAWDISPWDSSDWANDQQNIKLDWETISSPPFFAAGLRLQVASATATISWSVTNFVYELGGVL